MSLDLRISAMCINHILIFLPVSCKTPHTTHRIAQNSSGFTHKGLKITYMAKIK